MTTTRSRRLIPAAVLLLLVTTVALLSGNVQAVSRPARGELTYMLIAPEPKIVTGADGLSMIELAGFVSRGQPGNPKLPSADYYIALPPFVPLNSVALEIGAVEQSDLPGTHEIAPTEPLIGPEGDLHTATAVDVRNPAVYEQSDFFPARPVELAAISQMRKWRIATLRFHPVSYEPVSGRLRLATQVTVTLRYDAPDPSTVSLVELQDTVMDDEAEALFMNYAEAQEWYNVAPSLARERANERPGYVIITTEQIRTGSQQLDTFVTQKRILGYAVEVVTVEEIENSVTGQYPDERPEKIRKWLQDNYKSKNIEYVLLIGDPDPEQMAEYIAPETWANPPEDRVGDLPMKLVWGRALYVTDGCARAYAVTVKDTKRALVGYGTAKLNCTNPPISVTLSPNVTELPEASGEVEFTLTVENRGRSAVTIQDLEYFGENNDYLNLDGQGSCKVGEGLPVNGVSYTCQFTHTVQLNNNCLSKNTVTVNGIGANERDYVKNSDIAWITCPDNGIDVSLTIDRTDFSLPGPIAQFDLTVTNKTTGRIKIDYIDAPVKEGPWGLTDNEYGNCGDRVLNKVLEGEGSSVSCQTGQDLKIVGSEYPYPFAFQLYATDHYYADLLGDWDLDGDGLYGDSGDYLPGGVDFWPEVIVGRIPVYAATDPDWVTTLDNILRRTMAYEMSAETDWRRSAMLPMGVLQQSSKTDGAYLGEAMKSSSLSWTGFSTHTMYVNVNDNDLCQSSLWEVADESLVSPDTIINYWKNNPVGVTIWASHGNWEVAQFAQDCPGGDENKVNFASTDAAELGDSHPDKPALAFLAACNNAWPVKESNLAYELLKHATVGTVSASSYSTAARRWREPDLARADELSLAYYFAEGVVRHNNSIGEALFAAKRSPDFTFGTLNVDDPLGNVFAFNLYGDPSLRLLPTAWPAWNVYEGEPNNTQAKANPILLGDVVGGDLEYQQLIEICGPDYFRFSMPEDGYVVVDILHYGWVNIWLEQDNDVLLAEQEFQSAPGASEHHLLFYNLAAGDYYIELWDDHCGQSSYNPYELTVYRPLLVSAAPDNLGTGNAGGVLFEAGDILAHSDLNNDEERWVMFFDASDVGITTNVSNIAADGDNDLLLSLETRQRVKGIGVVTPWDIIAFEPETYGEETAGTFRLGLVGSEHQLTTNAERLDAIDGWTNGYDRCYGYPLSTERVSSVTGWLGPMKQDNEDVFCKVYDNGWRPYDWFFDIQGTNNAPASEPSPGRVPGLPRENVTAMAYGDNSDTMYLTIQGAGTIWNQRVTQKDIFAITYPDYTWGGIIWHGPDHGWNYDIDAIELNGP